MANIVGTDTANTLNGTTGNDTISGKGGNDIVYGKSGNDVIYGGTGNDTLYGDAGTDTVKGEAGNDIIKGGTGISYLYGGDGDDQIFYNPTTDNIGKVGTYLSGSILRGDGGTKDVLNIYNDAKVTVNGKETASHTNAFISDDGKLHIQFTEKNWDYESPIINVGKAEGFEVVTFTGTGGVTFTGDLYGNKGLHVKGTAGNDQLSSYYASDILEGGAGNDTFYSGGGNDKVISGSTDSDIIYFGGWGEGTTTVTGFNGAGVHGGDRIYIDDYYIDNPDKQVVESAGKTTFTLNTGEQLVVNVVGLVEGVDWFA